MTTTKRVKVEPEMSEGTTPPAVRIDIVQGGVLQSAELHDAQAAEFDLEPGDYEAHATALVPHGTPASVSFAVPLAVRVSPA